MLIMCQGGPDSTWTERLFETQSREYHCDAAYPLRCMRPWPLQDTELPNWYQKCHLWVHDFNFTIYVFYNSTLTQAVDLRKT
jgi:hypothetical protein